MTTTSRSAADLLESELGKRPLPNVVYNPYSLVALASRCFYRDYIAYLSTMKQMRDTLSKMEGGRSLRIEATLSSSKEPTFQCGTLDSFWSENKHLLQAFANGCEDVSLEALAAHQLETVAVGEGGAHVNGHLPAPLQQLGGIVLRPEGGDSQHGYVVPPVILHYATSMAQIAEMYCDDIEEEEEEDSNWAGRPSQWGVSDSLGGSIRDVLARVSTVRNDGSVLPMLSIDTNTTSEETLRLIAAYSTVLAVHHTELMKQGLLDTDALPVYPTTPSPAAANACLYQPDPVNTAPPIGDGDEDTYNISLSPNLVVPTSSSSLELPITLEICHPFPYLSTATMLPSAVPPALTDFPVATLASLANSFRVASKQGGRKLCDLPSFFVFPNTNLNGKERAARNKLNDATNKIMSFTSAPNYRRTTAALRPLEAVFAIEYLLPPLHEALLQLPSKEASSPHNQGLSIQEMLKRIPDVSFEDVQSQMPSFDSHSDTADGLAVMGTLFFDTDVPCGSSSSGTGVCGGNQVEPRLGHIPYIKFDSSSTYLSPPFITPPYLRCTLDQFLVNGEAKGLRMIGALAESEWRRRSYMQNTLGMALLVREAGANILGLHPLNKRDGFVVHNATLEDLKALRSVVVPDHFKKLLQPVPSLPTEGTDNESDSDGSREVAPTTSGYKPPTAWQIKTGEEAALIRASLARTTDVMKVANFLGLAPLVNLCGLVIAILLKGKSLVEVREMFESISPQPQ